MHRNLIMIAVTLALPACSPFLPVGNLEEDGSSGANTEDSGTSESTGTTSAGLDPDAPPVFPPEPGSLPPSGPGIQVAAPGTRLHPVVLRDGDAMSFVTWRDRELGVDCEFVTTSSGTHCLPSSRAVLDGPNCDMPAAAVWPDQPTPAVVIESVGSNCAASHRAYRVLSADVAPNSACYTGDDFPPPAIRLTEPMNDTDFVGGAYTFDTQAGFANHRLQADDGAWQILGAAYDGAPCDVRDFSGVDVCVDTRPWTTFLCPNHALGCEAAAYALVYGGECEVEITGAVALGAQVPTTEACGETWEDMNAQPLGAPLAAGALPQATAALLGQGRVRVRGVADASLAQLWPQRNFDRDTTARLFDTRLGVPCDVRYDAVEGPVTCVPALGIGYASGYFADSECTIPAYEGAIDLSLIEAPERCEFIHGPSADPIMGYVDVDGSDRVLYGVAVHDGPIFTSSGDGDACVETERPRYVSRMFRPVGGRLPDDTFAVLEKLELQ